ncbi:2Fe-2S ferredoxin-type domain-containing protein [Achaetomium macrosporum]|uniref:2Fe-2S ferredoxin-type domain-containing protein n=1 Tax=Achaetomium macrosporum TaxID=79813 RepID=A0AAN7CC83_9PEZI|nr:2Fe-2S ferredoxin-type domain-containing protein [Achaetomium macrosporum]
MSIPRLLAQTVPSLRLVPKRTGGSIARHVRSYTITSGASRSPRPRLRHWRWSTSAQTRPFSASPAVSHGHIEPPKPGEELYVTFIDKEGVEHKIAVSKGDNLLDIAQANDLEMEGACGGSCACSTCHVIVMDQEYYDRMPEPDDDENDMLDLAFGLQETSRLGCQVVMTPELDGLRVKLPAMTRNLQSSDFK